VGLRSLHQSRHHRFLRPCSYRRSRLFCPNLLWFHAHCSPPQHCKLEESSKLAHSSRFGMCNHSHLSCPGLLWCHDCGSRKACTEAARRMPRQTSHLGTGTRNHRCCRYRRSCHGHCSDNLPCMLEVCCNQPRSKTDRLLPSSTCTRSHQFCPSPWSCHGLSIRFWLGMAVGLRSSCQCTSLCIRNRSHQFCRGLW